jgi:hypothetical protein
MKVLRSINEAGALRCLDIFRRDDGSYGFEEYRRDPEEASGWYPVGGQASRRFASQEEAEAAAHEAVAWLKDAEGGL